MKLFIIGLFREQETHNDSYLFINRSSSASSHYDVHDVLLSYSSVTPHLFQVNTETTGLSDKAAYIFYTHPGASIRKCLISLSRNRIGVLDPLEA